MRKSLTITLLILILIGLFFSVVLFDQVVVFKDENFELAIREILNHSGKPIYRSQVMSFVELNLINKEISDLTGIEHFRNLEVLNLTNNDIDDVSQLQTLKNLKELNLSFNQIIDLDSANFDSITNLSLVSINLDHNLVEDEEEIKTRLSNIDLLEKFSSIEYLSLADNEISDFSPLYSLENLKELNLSENKLKDLDFLEKMSNLEHLNLRDNNIKDLSPIANLTKLTYLNLHSNEKINSIEPLAKLINLKTLILRNVPINDEISILQNFNSLIYLNVRNCAISNYSVIADLMANGALQNNPERNMYASVNIRDNYLSHDNSDPLLALRPYWNNIEFREPYSLPPLVSPIDVPVFSHTSGFYTTEFDLSLVTENSEVEILYTLDGSDPKIENVNSPTGPYQKTFRYTGPLTVSSREGDENVYSMIQTAYTGRPWLPRWAPPKGEVFKATTIRAIAYDRNNEIESNIVTQTYFVDEKIFARYSTLPVISLVADFDVLFDPDEGIYITDFYGFPFRYNDSKVPANIEYFEPQGHLGFQGRVEISLQGATSPASPQKGLHVFSGLWSAGEEHVDYPLFKNSESKANQLSEFKRFMLRAWGSARDWPVFFADAYNQTLMASSDQDIQAYQPVIVFINGEYWGLHEMREANKNPWYYQAHYYNDDEMEFDLLDWGGTVVDEGDSKHWDAMMNFIDQNDIRLTENYLYIKTQIDADNFIEYMIHGIYTGKMDWPTQNEYMWRPKTEDGKWRWTQFDMDQGMSGWAGPEYDMIAQILPNGDRPHDLFNVLIENVEFKNAFINRFADMMNTYFRTDVEIEHFIKLYDQLDPYMPEYQDRWQLNYDWEESRTFGLDLLNKRWDIRRVQVIDNFELEGSSTVTLKADNSMGNVAVNSIIINQDTIGVDDPSSWSGMYFHNTPIQINALPLPGFRFVRWEGSYDIDPITEKLVLFIEDDLILEAIFEPLN